MVQTTKYTKCLVYLRPCFQNLKNDYSIKSLKLLKYWTTGVSRGQNGTNIFI